MADLLQDVRFACRMLLRSPGATAVCVLSLALGIGANVTVFTLVKAVLLQSIGGRDVDRLVRVMTTEVRNGTTVELGATSRRNFEDLRERTTTLGSMALVIFAPVALAGSGGEPEQVFSQVVSSTFFDVLGAPMALGRGFADAADRNLGGHPVTVLSHGLWQRRFGGRPDLVGQEISINRRPFVVVGVAAKGVNGPTPVGGPDLWLPLAMYRETLTGPALEGYDSRRGLTYQAFGRLRDGVTLAQARADADGIGRALADEFPTDNRGRSYTVQPLADAALPPAFRRQLTTAGGVGLTIGGLVLLIACGNVANLLLARGVARRQEIAVRLAIGAGRWRLVRQLLTESAVLAAFGVVAGMVVAWWARATLWALRPPFMQEQFVDLSFDGRVLGFAAAAGAVTALLVGLAPALQTARPEMTAELKERTTLAGGTQWYRPRHLLVAGQVALSVVALAGAGLFLRSFANAQQIDLGFPVEGLSVIGLNVGTQGYDEVRGRDVYRRVLERAASVPGVAAATLSTAVPLFQGGFGRTTFRDDQDITDPRNGRLVQVNEITARYFDTLRIPILRGRAFTDADRPGGAPVAILNEVMARQLFPDADPIGRRIHIFNRPPAREVVGIARMAKYNGIGEDPQPLLYLPLEQNYVSTVTVQVRADGDASGAVLGTVRRELQALEPSLPLLNVNDYATVVRNALWAPRLGASLLAVFGGLALLLAAAGLYGVMAYAVSQRTREIGIRMALGASAGDVRSLVLRQGVVLVTLGLVVGLLAAAGLSTLVANLLYGLSGPDPLTLIGVALLLLSVCVVAAWRPARRASAIDPIEALRR